jgi:hypothetical protein
MCICLAAFLRLARESGGGNAIKLLLRLILGLSLGVAMLLAKIQPSTLVFLPETFTAKTAFSAMRSASEPVLRYVAGSTIKVEQLIGEEDKQVHQPTLSQTVRKGWKLEGGVNFVSTERGSRVLGDLKSILTCTLLTKH